MPKDSFELIPINDAPKDPSAPMARNYPHPLGRTYYNVTDREIHLGGYDEIYAYVQEAIEHMLIRGVKFASVP